MHKRYVEFAQRTAASGQNVQLRDILKPQTYQVVLELTYDL
jgi:hypothetical protein